MQREYRGQRTDTKEWVHGYFVKTWDETCYIITEFGSDVTCCDECGANDITAYEVVPETVGKSTGLPDKNGKEIYEGDVVKGFIPEIAGEPERKGAVKFGNYGWIIDFETKKWECKIGKVGFCSFRDYEVIGNIYDNPELLQEVDK